MPKHPLDNTWRCMVERCYNKASISYKNYGARGVKMCEFMRSGPKSIEIIIGLKPSSEHSIERPNNDLGYFCGQCPNCAENKWPKNLKWATRLEQNRNQRDLRYITIGEETRCLAEWAEAFKIGRSTVNARVMRGESDPLLLFRKPHTSLEVTIGGSTKTISEWSSMVGIDQSSFRKRLRKGWDDKKILSAKA